MDIVKLISYGLVKNVLVVRVNGEVWDLICLIDVDVMFELLIWKDEDGKVIFWYLFVYLMVEVLEDFYFGIKFGIGLVIDNGFYYDIDFGECVLFIEDFKKIEDKMIELV